MNLQILKSLSIVLVSAVLLSPTLANLNSPLGNGDGNDVSLSLSNAVSGKLVLIGIARF
jgi:hypothetical protein